VFGAVVAAAGKGVRVGTADGIAVKVTVVVGSGVRVAVGVGVAVWVDVAVLVGDGVLVAVAVGGMVVALGSSVGVAVGSVV
jgi:hypothetical protein